MLVESVVAALMFLYPFLLLLIRSGTNVCFVALLVIAILQILRTPSKYVGDADTTFYLYGGAMASLAIATFISHCYHWDFKLGTYDGPSRFLLCIPIYLFLRQVPIRYLTVIQYGFMAGAFVTIFVAFSRYPHPIAFLETHKDDRIPLYFLNVIHFGDLSLVLGLMAVMTINWNRTDSYIVRLLKVASLIGGLNASILSGSRGGWMAIPPVFATWATLMRNSIPHRAIAFGAIGLIAGMIGLYFFAAQVNVRLNRFVADVSTLDTNPDAGTGLRLQIWRAALHVFVKNPIFGAGPDEFARLAPALGSEGYLTPRGVEIARAEVHNEILKHAVDLGIFGIVATLLIYFVPLALFVRAARNPDHIIRRTGVLGSCFVISFVVFGLTVETFDLKMTATFYSLTIAVFLAIATNNAGNGKHKALPP